VMPRRRSTWLDYNELLVESGRVLIVISCLK
jgi:hypothetical protein